MIQSTMSPKGSSPGKKQKKKKAASKKLIKLKKALVACPSDTDEQSQSLLVTQPQRTQHQRRLAGAQSDKEDGHGGEGASQTSSSRHAKCKRTPTATITSGQTLNDYEAQEGQEEGPPPRKKLSSMSDCLTAEQEQKLVDFLLHTPYSMTRPLKNSRTGAKENTC